MKCFVPRSRRRLNTLLNPLHVSLLMGFVFTLLWGSNIASAHSWQPIRGTTCTDFCEGGHMVTTNNSFISVSGEFIFPCPSSEIWVGLGGHVNANELGNAGTIGLAAGVIQNPFPALAINTGPGAGIVVSNQGIRCNDDIFAMVEISPRPLAFVMDKTTGQSFSDTRVAAPMSQQAKCVVEVTNPGAPLARFGTLTFINQCHVVDSVAGYESFGAAGASYLWLENNSSTVLAGDPFASRSGLGTGPEEIQWFASR